MCVIVTVTYSLIANTLYLHTRLKRLFACGCQQEVSASMKNRHLCGQGPHHVAAAMLSESRYLSNDHQKRQNSTSQAQNSDVIGSSVSHSNPTATQEPASVPLSQSGPSPADFVIDPMDADNVDVNHMEVDPDFHHLQP